MAPPFVLDYLAAHEVAHLRELNHSHRFWKITHQLFSATLPRHRESLISYEGCNRASRSQSYMTYEFMLSLSVCKNLESLAFTLHISDLSSKNEHILNDGVSTNIKLQFYCYLCAFSDIPTFLRRRLYR